MIGQYLSNNNETATVAFRQKICQLNSPLSKWWERTAEAKLGIKISWIIVSSVLHLCTLATFSLQNFSKPMNSTTFVFFDKYCPIVDQLGSKDSSRDFQLNCVISYFLPTFNTPCKRLKIDVMEREWKNYNFWTRPLYSSLGYVVL
jgi:hypothetical protein